MNINTKYALFKVTNKIVKIEKFIGFDKLVRCRSTSNSLLYIHPNDLSTDIKDADWIFETIYNHFISIEKISEFLYWVKFYNKDYEIIKEDFVSKEIAEIMRDKFNIFIKPLIN